jgi:hypothetical protein
MGEATMVFSGTLRVGEADREAGAITFEATGHGAGSASAQGRMRVRLRESAGSTTVSVQADVDMTAWPTRIDGDHTRHAARTLFSRLGSEVAERIARDEEPRVRGTVRLLAPPVPTPASTPGGIRGFVRSNPGVVPATLLGGAALLVLLSRRPAARRRDFD